MNIKTLLSGILLLTTFLFGQFEDPVSITALVKENARAGEVTEVQVIFSIDRGWHIYGMEEIEDGPIPTSIQIVGEVIAKQGIIIEPEPIVSYDEGFEMDIPHHDGRVIFNVPIKLKENIESGEILLTAEATYQSCNNTICYPPMEQLVEFDLIVEQGEARTDKLILMEESEVALNTNELTLDV